MTDVASEDEVVGYRWRSKIKGEWMAWSISDIDPNDWEWPDHWDDMECVPLVPRRVLTASSYRNAYLAAERLLELYGDYNVNGFASPPPPQPGVRVTEAMIERAAEALRDWYANGEMRADMDQFKVGARAALTASIPDSGEGQGASANWFELGGDARLGECATEDCGGQPTWRFEAGGIGANYCSGCRAKIEALDRALTGKGGE